MSDANLGPHGRLTAVRTRPHSARTLFRLPLGLGRILHTLDPGDATRFAGEFFQTHLHAHHHRTDTGETIAHHALGSGLVTNVGVLAMANDFAWAQNAQTLKLANQHASGTGTTAAAASDFQLQTSAGPSPVAGTQSLVSAANSQAYRTVATLNYTSTLAITEWGLHTSATLSATTGTPFTATTATSATVTGTPYSASSGTVQGEQQLIVVPGTTTVWGLITGNTTSVLTVPAWYTQASGAAGSTPGSTEAFTLKPVMWDHKVFAAINVVSGDSITFTYTVTVNSGG